MEPLREEEVHHFGYLHPTLKAHEKQPIRIVHSETKSKFLSCN